MTYVLNRFRANAKIVQFRQSTTLNSNSTEKQLSKVLDAFKIIRNIFHTLIRYIDVENNPPSTMYCYRQQQTSTEHSLERHTILIESDSCQVFISYLSEIHLCGTCFEWYSPTTCCRIVFYFQYTEFSECSSFIAYCSFFGYRCRCCCHHSMSFPLKPTEPSQMWASWLAATYRRHPTAPTKNLNTEHKLKLHIQIQRAKWTYELPHQKLLTPF